MYLLRRISQALLALFGVSIILFYLLHAMPGDPSDQILMLSGSEMSIEAIETVRKDLFLDRPIHERYLCWVLGSSGPSCESWPTRGLLFGDLGASRVYNQPVTEIFFSKLLSSFRLLIPAFLIAAFLALGLGALASTPNFAWVARMNNLISFSGLAFPVHWIGLSLLLVFSVQWRIFPVGGINNLSEPSFFGALQHAFLPVFVLSLFYFSRWVGHVQSQFQEVLKQDYIQVARAKGLKESRIILVHALPAAALPIITVIGHSIPGIFSGAVVTERVFSYPGLGLLLLDSIKSDDYFLAMTILLVFALVSFVCTIIIDLTYQKLDPRIRLGGES